MTATLTKLRPVITDEGMPGYVVTMNGDEETCEREEVEIICIFTLEGVTVNIDRTVTLTAEEPSDHISVFSDRGAEMMRHDEYLNTNDSVTIYPAGHIEGPADRKPFGRRSHGKHPHRR